MMCVYYCSIAGPILGDIEGSVCVLYRYKVHV